MEPQGAWALLTPPRFQTRSHSPPPTPPSHWLTAAEGADLDSLGRQLQAAQGLALPAVEPRN